MDEQINGLLPKAGGRCDDHGARSSAWLQQVGVSALKPRGGLLPSDASKGTQSMKYPSGVLFAAIVAILCLTGGGSAQASSNQPNSSNVAQQFKSGANRVGEGAVQIGQGIKQGAILTWEAVRDGAASAAARFNGGQSPSITNTNHAQ